MLLTLYKQHLWFTCKLKKKFEMDGINTWKTRTWVLSKVAEKIMSSCPFPCQVMDVPVWDFSPGKRKFLGRKIRNGFRRKSVGNLTRKKNEVVEIKSLQSVWKSSWAKWDWVRRFYVLRWWKECTIMLENKLKVWIFRWSVIYLANVCLFFAILC